jgi:hypothetical protein
MNLSSAKSAAIAYALQTSKATDKLRAVVAKAVYNVSYFGDAAMMAEVEADQEAFTLEVKVARKAA